MNQWQYRRLVFVEGCKVDARMKQYMENLTYGAEEQKKANADGGI